MAAAMLMSVLCLLWFYTACGQEVTGPSELVTDGTRLLNLTCDAQSTTAVDRYVWFTPGVDDARCPTEERGVCSFPPKFSDDNQNVTCKALGPQGQTLATASYLVKLKYPPTFAPNITYQLLPGNEVNVTCTVYEGKPLVTTVTFQCENPTVEDQADVVTEDGGAVNSSLIPNITLAEANNISCTCSAYWAPEPGLYTLTTTVTYADILKETTTTANVVTPPLHTVPADGTKEGEFNTSSTPHTTQDEQCPGKTAEKQKQCREAENSAVSNRRLDAMIFFSFFFTLCHLNVRR